MLMMAALDSTGLHLSGKKYSLERVHKLSRASAETPTHSIRIQRLSLKRENLTLKSTDYIYVYKIEYIT